VSKIAKAADEILEKMSFEDYKKPKKNIEEQPFGRRHIKKNKLTLYLTAEEERLFNEIYIKRMKENNKTDRSSLFAEAVQLLHRKELAGK
jgi:hypothetical protein